MILDYIIEFYYHTKTFGKCTLQSFGSSKAEPSTLGDNSRAFLVIKRVLCSQGRRNRAGGQGLDFDRQIS